MNACKGSTDYSKNMKISMRMCLESGPWTENWLFLMKLKCRHVEPPAQNKADTFFPIIAAVPQHNNWNRNIEWVNLISQDILRYYLSLPLLALLSENPRLKAITEISNRNTDTQSPQSHRGPQEHEVSLGRSSFKSRRLPRMYVIDVAIHFLWRFSYSISVH